MYVQADTCLCIYLLITYFVGIVQRKTSLNNDQTFIIRWIIWIFRTNLFFCNRNIFVSNGKGHLIPINRRQRLCFTLFSKRSEWKSTYPKPIYTHSSTALLFLQVLRYSSDNSFSNSPWPRHKNYNRKSSSPHILNSINFVV